MKLWRFLFGCRHKVTSRVWTLDGRSYVVCMGCKRELAYSWEEMRVTGNAL